MKAKPHHPIARLHKAEPMEFLSFSSFNDGEVGAFWSEASGTSPWELHSDCDEFLQIIEGAVQIEILPVDGGPAETVNVRAGEFIVIPQGHWHRQTLLERTRELYLTPGNTEHSMADDPRT